MLFKKNMEFKLKSHQIIALDKLKSGAILNGGVGSGKTITSLYFYKKKYSEKKLYIITTAKKRNEKDFEREAKTLNIKNIIVDSWNNVSKYTTVKNSFFIFDEQRAIGSGNWSKSFITIAHNNKWILLTATPGDTWMDYIPVFIANGFYKNRTQFIKRHVIYNPYITNFPSIKGFKEEEYLRKLRNEILIPMKMNRHTKRNKIPIFNNYDVEMYKRISKDRFNYITNKPIENVSEYTHTLRKLVCDEEKLINLKLLFNKHKKIIVFYNYNYELEMIRNFLDNNKILYKEWNGQKHDQIPNTNKWLYLVQYIAGSEGWNCITTDTIVFFSLNYSFKTMEQAMGRIDRMNTNYTDLYYYLFITRSSIDNAILKAIDTKKKFNENDFYNNNFKELIYEKRE